MLSSFDVLSSQGLLSKVIDGFTPRISQQEMAKAVERAIELETQLIVEAGTGTGKTFAYLIPALLSQKKTIISTGTKNLQDQLYLKDLPIIKNILSFIGKVVLLKGRANYLCHHRLRMNREDGRFSSRQVIAELEKVFDWSSSTQTGDIAELNDISEDSPVWPYVTSTPDNCLNQECDFYKQCHVIKARQEALAADVVIVNHHLFFADVALQEEGFGELLPGADVIIFDEAHHLPDIATHFFSTHLSGRQLSELARDCEMEFLQSAKDMSDAIKITNELQDAVQVMRTSFGLELKKMAWPDFPDIHLQNAIAALKEKLKNLEAILKVAAARSKGLENCWSRALEFIELFHLLTGQAPDNFIHWFETHLKSFTIQLTPVIVAEQFKKALFNKKRSLIFTSATLTVRDSFDLFISSLGLEKALQMQLKSPFNYQEQALLYVPRGLPDARNAAFLEKMLHAVIPLLEITQGKTFLLFTSYKALEFFADNLKNYVSYPLLVQGTMSKRELIEQFKLKGNAILLGTSSFWFGVDVRGDALSCVVIDKLPFTAPDDPILQARIKMIKKQGRDPFMEYQLPQAVLSLKQGAGRLIRDAQDRGVLVICDPRLVGNYYGDVFLKSLPDMPRTRELDNVKKFFQREALAEGFQ